MEKKINKKSKVDSRKEILRLVKTSIDEKMIPILYRGESMHYVSFSEVIDIVLYYLSLQTDIGKIGSGVKWQDFFWYDIQKLWMKKKNEYFDFIKSSPWVSCPGPCGGTAGPAESYMSSYPGFFYLTIKIFFLWPENLAKEYDGITWPKYKKVIENNVFPKFRRQWHAKKLNLILDFAEDVYKALKKRHIVQVKK